MWLGFYISGYTWGEADQKQQQRARLAFPAPPPSTAAEERAGTHDLMRMMANSRRLYGAYGESDHVGGDCRQNP